MKIFLVTFDGYKEAYGSELYTAGVFAVKTEAENYAKELKDKYDVYTCVTELELNKKYEPKDSNFCFSNKNYLGGYSE